MNTLAINSYVPLARRYYTEIERYYKNLLSEGGITEVIIQAAEAQVPVSCMGKRTSFADHQHRVGKIRCALGAKELLKTRNLQDINNSTSFEDIFKVTERVKKSIYRLGDLWSYDTAQRIAFSKGFYPNEVYLQSGAYHGARSLANNGYVAKSDLRAKRNVPSNIFPPPLDVLPPFIIENVLCVGKRQGWL